MRTKMETEYQVQGYFGTSHRNGKPVWECVTAAETRREGLGYLKDYRENDPGNSYRLRRVRVTAGA